MNYFNYFTEIEDAFIRRRGKHLLLSPMDWALIESWKELDVPLHVALRGIERAFESWEAKARKRSIKSLLYCQEEVEAQFAEWRESRVGASEQSNGNAALHDAEALPFSRAAILQHLEHGRTSLLSILEVSKRNGAGEFSEVVERAIALLTEIQQDFAGAAAPDAQKLEQSLSGVERMLSDATRAAAAPEQFAQLELEVKEQLKPYRKHMDAEVYRQTFDNLLLKRLREQFGIPRLSLFYL